MVALSFLVDNGDAHLKNFGLLYTDPTTSDCRLAPAFDVVNTTAYIPEDVLALDLCGQKSFFSARQGLLDFAKVCQVADPYDRLQRLILTAEFVIGREAEVAQPIPHVVAAIGHCRNRLKEVFLAKRLHAVEPLTLSDLLTAIAPGLLSVVWFEAIKNN